MVRKGKDFELAYKWLYDLDSDKYKVSSPAYVFDKTEERKREVDVLIEYNDDDNHHRRIAVECRDRNTKENAMWIEQLVTKRLDLELDYIIAVTTKKFTDGAIMKARFHGVILEKAEYINAGLIDSISRDFFVDLFFCKYKVKMLNFILDNECVSLNELLSKINSLQKYNLIQYLNTEYYFSFDPKEILDSNNINLDIFFANKDNCISSHKVITKFDDNKPKIIEELHIKQICIDFAIKPYKVTLLLNKSLSIFDVVCGCNKKYSVLFGNDEEYVRIRYLDNGENYLNFKIKDRKYYRFVYANMNLNTILPKNSNKQIECKSTFEKECWGVFDLTSVI